MPQHSVNLLAWHGAELPESMSDSEFAAAQRFCPFGTRRLAAGGPDGVLQVLCASPADASVAAAALSAAAADARHRIEIEEHLGKMIDARVAAIIAQATGP